MNIQNSPYLSAVQMPKNSSAQIGNNRLQTEGLSFEEILNRKAQVGGETGELKFSKHASQRLMDRNINLSEEQLNRLEKGAMLSSQKGIKESLVVMDEFAFIVNTQKNTVITAMEQGRQGENIYTNIDGAVFV